MLTCLLLGTPQLLLDQQPVNVTRRKSRALVYYLAAHVTPITRDQLLSLFWPDHDRPAAQQILRTTVHGLRSALGSALVVSDDSLALDRGSFVDTRLFEARLGAPSSDPQLLAAALELYRGDFLGDFTLPDNPGFDDWAAAEREHYRRLAIRGFAALAQQYEARQDFAAALDALDRALAFDPLQEDLQRAGMRLQYRGGDRVGAIRRYEQLRKLLDDEMGVPPMNETRELYDAIITDALLPEQQLSGNRPRTAISLGPQTNILTQKFAQTLPFVGRSTELQKLHELEVAHQLALIEGEPGIGKTRLVHEYIRISGRLALIGVARELDRALPYQPVIEALRGLLTHAQWPALRSRLDLSPVWLAETARLLPELVGPAAAPQRAPAADESRLWESINQFLQAIARQHPLILFLDDLQWADDSTLALLAYLVRQTERAPIFFIATTRPTGPRSSLITFIQALVREDRLTRLALARLNQDDTATLARHLTPTHAGPLAEWFARTAEGNPYIIAELVRYAREQNLLRTDGMLDLAALPSSAIVPQTVYSLIQSRLSRLSEAARRVLDAAVAAGREFEFDVVARAAALSEHAALDALDELRAAGLIYPLNGLRYSFDHTLTMEVAYQEVGEPRHRLLHRRIAEAMENVYRDRLDSVAGLLAWHFAEGNDSRRATRYALRAGQLAAGVAAWKEAIGFYQLALQGASNDRKVEVLMALGEAHLRAGEAAQATESYRAALALTESRAVGDQSEANEARLAVAHSLLTQARFAESIALVQQVLSRGRPHQVIHAEFIWGTALSLEGADLTGAAQHLGIAEMLLREQGEQTDGVMLARIAFELGSVAAQQGDLTLAIARYNEALAASRAARTVAARPWQILAHNNLAYHMLLQGDPAAVEHAQAGLHLAQEKGEIGLQPYLLSTLGEIALAQDDLTTAEQRFTEGLMLAERISMPERVAGLTANLGLVAVRRGQTSLAIHRLSSALARADALGTRHLAAQIRLWLAPLLPPAEARACLVEARAIAESGGRRRLLDEIERLEKALFAI